MKTADIVVAGVLGLGLLAAGAWIGQHTTCVSWPFDKNTNACATTFKVPTLPK